MIVKRGRECQQFIIRLMAATYDGHYGKSQRAPEMNPCCTAMQSDSPHPHFCRAARACSTTSGQGDARNGLHHRGLATALIAPQDDGRELDLATDSQFAELIAEFDDRCRNSAIFAAPEGLQVTLS